jgi:uncharacterized membrane protein YccC
MLRWSEKLTYCTANVAAVLAALYIALWLDLDRPYWAMFTVFIISKPISGAVRAKGAYRLAGTLIGASMSVLLVPPLVQAPLLLSLAVSAWVGICLFCALQDRTPRSYAFLLSGYSVAIVGLSAVNAPTEIFDVAVSRLEEISIGIFCATIAHSVFFPRNFGEVLRSQAETTLRNSALLAADALVLPPKALPTIHVASVARKVSELHVLYSQVGFETSNVRRVPAIMAGLLDHISVILPKASLVSRALAARQMIGPPSALLVTNLKEAAAILNEYSVGGQVATDAVLANLEAFSEMIDEEEQADSIELEQLVVRHVADLIRDLQEGGVLAAALTEEEAAQGISALLPANAGRPLYRDQALALLSAASASGATLVACGLWIWNAWPEGFVAAQFAAICCTLFATLDNPSKTVGEAVIGILVALPIAAVYEFAILPNVDGFASLALVLLPMLALFSYLQTNERLEGAAMILAIAFSGALALQESFASDFAVFVNSNLAEVCGPMIAIAMLLIFRTIDPVWNANRMIRSVWFSISTLDRSEPAKSDAWLLQMFDRIGLAAQRFTEEKVTERDLLKDLRIGLNVMALREIRNRFAASIDAAMQDVAVRVAKLYEAALSNSSTRPSAALLNKLEGLAAALEEMPQSEERLSGLTAVMGLRLDLDAAMFVGAMR